MVFGKVENVERNWWSDWHEYHLESFYCSVDHRRRLHNRHCMWQKMGRGGSEARKPRSLKSGGLKPSSLIEVYAYGNLVPTAHLTSFMHVCISNGCNLQRHGANEILLTGQTIKPYNDWKQFFYYRSWYVKIHTIARPHSLITVRHVIETSSGPFSTRKIKLWSNYDTNSYDRRLVEI